MGQCDYCTEEFNLYIKIELDEGVYGYFCGRRCAMKWLAE